jgi:hypothetical protein
LSAKDGLLQKEAQDENHCRTNPKPMGPVKSFLEQLLQD